MVGARLAHGLRLMGVAAHASTIRAPNPQTVVSGNWPFPG